MKRKMLLILILIVSVQLFVSGLPTTGELGIHPIDAQDMTHPDPIDSIPFGGFVDYKGIADSDIYFSYSDSTSKISFKESEIAFQIFSTDKTSQFSYTFPGSNLVSPEGEERNVRIVNYFIGDMCETDIPTWNEIWYHNIYQQIDLRYYYSESGMKYEFIVHPGADPSIIRVQVTESAFLSVEDNEVLLTFPESHFRFQDNLGEIYEKNGNFIKGRFQKDLEKRNCYGFSIDDYDTSDFLIIDPILVFSTYLGGSDDDSGSSVAVDQVGCLYVTGTTISNDFPIVNALNSSLNSGTDIFITKLNERGDTILFSTYLGGASTDIPHGIKIDSNGYVIITGRTRSDDFPVINAYQDTRGGDWDVFVMKLTSSGNELNFSSYFGGSARDYGYDLGVGLDDSIFITGETRSSNFPTKNAMTTSLNGTVDVIAVNFGSSGNLIFSTYLGGGGDEIGAGICVGDDNTCYITGFADAGFPMKSPYNASFGGGIDIFVCRLNSTGNGFIFSTYLGGSTIDAATDIGLDASNNVYIVGYSHSNDYPLLDEYQSSLDGGSDIIISVLNSTGNGLKFSTYYGGSSDEAAQGGLDIKDDLVYVTGYTCSSDFPLYLPYDDTYGGDYSDSFILSINTTEYQLEFSSFWSGVGISSGEGIVVDAWGDFYLCGKTYSIPVKNALDDTYNGMGDAFISKFSKDEVIPTIDSPNDKIAEKGNPSEEIVWNPTDNNPLYYQIFVNNSLEVDAAWDGSAVIFSLSLLDFGVTNLTITVYDRALNSAIDTVFVTMDDTTAPTINDILDFFYEEGTTGHKLVWEPSDWNPATYQIFQDSSLIKQGMWNSSSENISLNIDGLLLGIHNFTIIVYDENLNTANDTVLVTVLDSTPPIVTEIADFQISEGEPGFNITWFVSDANPNTYEVLLDGVLVDFGNWTDSVSILIDPLALGEFNFTLVVFDTFSNSASDTIIVIVVDETEPTIYPHSDIEYGELSMGHFINWTPIDLHPQSFVIYIDGIPSKSGTWNYSSESIMISVDGLTMGAYNYTLVVTDVGGNTAIDEVLVVVVDETEPTIYPHSDIEYGEFSTGYFINWTPSDLHPQSFDIYVDGILAKSGVWNSSSESIMISVDGLTMGAYNYTLVVTDVGGNTAIDEVLVVVVDETEPVLDSPSDVEYYESTTGHLIIWHPSDFHPQSYIVYLNGTIIRSGTWNSSSESIMISVDGLSAGLYNYTITITDIGGHSISDTVFVIVNVDTTILGLGSIAGLSIIVIIIAFGISRRRR